VNNSEQLVKLRSLPNEAGFDANEKAFSLTLLVELLSRFPRRGKLISVHYALCV
jgi:hypothetical protein